ncbi:MAG: hypothetical protein P8Y70_03920 [Candidatus Lokiarchaeota archaeon]
MDKLSNRLSKIGTRVFVITQMIIPIILIIYAIYRIISGAITGTMFSKNTIIFWIDALVFWYGIGSLLANLYIIPLASEQFYKAVELSKFSWWRKEAKKAARKVKKKFFTLKKDYAKAQIQDQMTVKEILDLWRNKFAVNLLLIFAVGTIVFTPVAFICVLFWLRLYIFFRRRTLLYEKIALLIAMCWIGFVVAIFPFLDPSFPFLGSVYSSLRGYYWTVNISYLIGILIASMLFIKKILNLQGITYQKMRLNLKEKKIETLKKEKEELQKTFLLFKKSDFIYLKNFLLNKF